MITTVILLLFASIAGPAFGAPTYEAGLTADSADKPSTALVQDLKKIPKADTKTLFQGTFFHRFIEHTSWDMTNYASVIMSKKL